MFLVARSNGHFITVPLSLRRIYCGIVIPPEPETPELNAGRGRSFRKEGGTSITGIELLNKSDFMPSTNQLDNFLV